MKRLKTISPLIFFLIFSITPTLLTVRAQYIAPKPHFTYTPAEPFTNVTITFNASSSEPGWNGTNPTPIVGYQWNFSDGTPLVNETNPITTHVYTQAGNYTVTLKVIDTIGLWNTASQTVEVHVADFDLTIGTAEPSTPYHYIKLSEVQIGGNLTLDGNPVSDGLVVLKVRSPTNQLVILRTLKTGTTPISESPINITRLFLCDSEGNPVNYTIKSVPTYIWVTIKNIGEETLSPVVIVLNLYKELYPMSFVYAGISELSAGSSFGGTISPSIPSWVPYGNVSAYVSVFSGLDGYPYCQEKFLKFPVADPLDPPSGIPTSGTSPSSNTNGTYTFISKIPVDSTMYGFTQGDYTITVQASYESQQAANSTILPVKLCGDVDGDGDVDPIDIFSYLAVAYGSEEGDSNYDPDCDFDGDGDVDPIDIFSYAAFFYGKTGY